jgi:photosystem II stability/assembly factor-like uncharacterized protein
VYESWDAGTSWHRLGALPPHLEVHSVALDASLPGRYVVATRHSIFLSTDAGKHWSLVASSLPGNYTMFVLQDPWNPSVFYAGPSTLWKSTDHGATWQRAGLGEVFAPDGIQGVTPTRSGALYTAIWGGGVAASTNQGRTWKRLERGLYPKVMDVETGDGRALWAGTDRGVFRSIDGGNTWRRMAVPTQLSTTSLVVQGRMILAGGDHAVYRSADGGKTWQLAMDGLPLDPYVYGLVADPSRSGRIYASLNSDGLFRSDDGGRHWTAIDRGIPLSGDISQAKHVLFLRDGALWITDGAGTDPGQLTVDQDVRLAELSPDDAEAAYVAGSGGAWAVRVLSAQGGSAARTLLTGNGAMPTSLLWSPTAATLAVVRPSQLEITDLTPGSHAWPLRHDERVIGWSGDGRWLLTWNAATGAVQTRQPLTGSVIATLGSAAARPLLSPGAREVAVLQDETLLTGKSFLALRPVTLLPSACSLVSWSGDGARLLLRCGAEVRMVAPEGRTVATAELPGPVSWAPASHATLLFFRQQSLWRWSAHGSALVVRGALPLRAGR